MEWAWILNEARKLLSIDTSAEIRAAVAFAEKYGIDPETHITYNRVRDDGVAIDKGSRVWPNTERLKSSIALYELDGIDPASVIDPTCRLLLDRYLAYGTPGTWMDAYDADGAAATTSVPASTLYHLFLAFAEVLRISDQAD